MKYVILNQNKFIIINLIWIHKMIKLIIENLKDKYNITETI